MKFTIAALLGALNLTAASPDQAKILKEAQKCGLTEEQVLFSHDEEGVLNVDVIKLPGDGEDYVERVYCFMEWAAPYEIPLGVSLESEGEQ